MNYIFRVLMQAKLQVAFTVIGPRLLFHTVASPLLIFGSVISSIQGRLPAGLGAALWLKCIVATKTMQNRSCFITPSVKYSSTGYIRKGKFPHY